jgi:hypothetical protein
MTVDSSQPSGPAQGGGSSSSASIGEMDDMAPVAQNVDLFFAAAAEMSPLDGLARSAGSLCEFGERPRS